MMDGAAAAGMQIDMSQMTPEEQQAYQQQIYEQQQQYAQQMMAAGYAPDGQQQLVDQMGNPITQVDYQMLAQQQMYGDEQNDYGQEMLRSPNQKEQYMQEEHIAMEETIQDKIQKIIQECQQTNKQYVDLEFPANDNSLYLDPTSPPDYAQDMPVVEWKRPEHISRDQEPKL